MRLSIVFQSYSAYEAEWLTERLLDSKDYYSLTEQVLRGDIQPQEFLYSLQLVAETFHLSFQERQKQLSKEGNIYE